MEIIYTSHLEFRLKIRNIPHDLPARIFKQAKKHYYDNVTKHYIAIHQAEVKSKIREIALTYDRRKDAIEIITVHPIKPYQKLSRITSGRWRRYE